MEPSRVGKASLKACAQSRDPYLWFPEQIPASPQGYDVETNRIVLGKGLLLGFLNKALLCEISYLMNPLFEGTSGPSPEPPRNVSFREA